MVRERLARRRADGDGFRWRGDEVWRVEGFTDAVFAFAVTLLVVSLEVPGNFDELLETMRGFFAFALSFALLILIWYEHYKFFRRYGLRDAPTFWINAVLLFLILFFVYPLKFLFTLLADQLLGQGGTELIRDSQLPLLMVIYGAGFVAVQLIFVIFYWRAYSLREALELDAFETRVTRSEIGGFSLNAAVGAASILIAVVGGEAWVSWAGWIYLLTIPLQKINAAGRRRRRTTRAENAEIGAPPEGDAAARKERPTAKEADG